jgi:hypothetical protein
VTIGLARMLVRPCVRALAGRRSNVGLSGTNAEACYRFTCATPCGRQTREVHANDLVGNLQNTVPSATPTDT